MKRAPFLAIKLWLSITLPAHATDSITVLGLPLGGKLPIPIRQCSTQELGADVRSLCWVSAPDVIKGARSGHLQVSGAD
jgi:hypothetical protein